MYTVAPMSWRQSEEPIELDGHIIPAYTMMTLPLFSMHRRKELWGPDVDTFRPERFDPTSDECKNRHKFAFIPFGGGSRKCLGYKFALR